MNKKRRNGFTLIEIILALLVISIGIVAMIGLLGTSLDTSSKTHDDVSLVSFSDMVFNYYHAAENWTDIPPEGSWTIPDYAGQNHDLTSGRYTCRLPGSAGTEKEHYTVSYHLSARQNKNIKELTLQVWPGFSTNSSSRTFYTEIYNWTQQP